MSYYVKNHSDQSTVVSYNSFSYEIPPLTSVPIMEVLVALGMYHHESSIEILRDVIRTYSHIEILVDEPLPNTVDCAPPQYGCSPENGYDEYGFYCSNPKVTDVSKEQGTGKFFSVEEIIGMVESALDESMKEDSLAPAI